MSHVKIKQEEDIYLLEHTPAAALGSCRKKLPDISKDGDTYEKILQTFKKYDIRYFFYIGGNDSIDTVAKLSAFFTYCRSYKNMRTVFPSILYFDDKRIISIDLHIINPKS